MFESRPCDRALSGDDIPAMTRAGRKGHPAKRLCCRTSQRLHQRPCPRGRVRYKESDSKSDRDRVRLERKEHHRIRWARRSDSAEKLGRASGVDAVLDAIESRENRAKTAEHQHVNWPSAAQEWFVTE